MTTIAREIIIDQTKENVWEAVAKFGDICHGSPGVSSSHITSTQQGGIGATRHCDFTMMGATAEERITEWKEGESLTIEVYELKKLPGIESMIATFSVRSENNKTVLRADLAYQMKNIFFDMMNWLMMKKMNTKNWNAVLAGHKKYIETGIRVDENTELELDKVIVLN